MSSFEKDLDSLIDHIYQLNVDTYDRTWDQLASAADLSPSTVRNLGDRVTKYPRFLTVQKLARAVGLNVTLEQKLIVKRRAG